MEAINQTISSDGTTPKLPEYNQKLVNVLINYPDDFKGEKHFKQGDVRVDISEESAALFVKGGYGKIISADEALELLQKKAQAQADETAKLTGDDAGSKEPEIGKKKAYTAMNKSELHAELDAREIAYDGTETNPDLVQLLKDSDDEGA